MVSEDMKSYMKIFILSGHKEIEVMAGAWVSGRALVWHAKGPTFHHQYHKQRTRAP